MEGIYYNKIAGAVLFSLLVLVGLRSFVEILYPKGEDNLSKGTIVVTQNPPQAAGAPGKEAGAEEAAAAPQQEPPVDVALADASADAGAAAVKPCKTCHSFDKGGGNKVGPNLWGVVGRDIGKEPGFSYSEAFQHKGGQWTFEELYKYLKNPKAEIPGNKMLFNGVPNPQQRANIIAYLDKQSDSPLPLPKK